MSPDTDHYTASSLQEERAPRGSPSPDQLFTSQSRDPMPSEPEETALVPVSEAFLTTPSPEEHRKRLLTRQVEIPLEPANW